MDCVINEQELKQEIMSADDRVNALVVDSQETYEIAGAAVIDLDSLAKRITAYWDDPIKKAFDAHRALTAKRAEMLKPVDDRKKSLRKKISDYLTAIEKKRQEEQRKADEERRKREQAERDKLERQAAKAEEKGKTERAEDLRTQAAEVYVPPVVVVPEVEKTTRIDTGTVSQKKDIKVSVTDPLKILKAILDDRLPVGVVTINDAKLKQAIKLAGINHLDGCLIEQVVNAQFRAGVA
jgi:hypothetical protein